MAVGDGLDPIRSTQATATRPATVPARKGGVTHTTGGTLTLNEIGVCNATSAAFSMALPAAVDGGECIAVKSDASANAVTVTGALGGSVTLSAQGNAQRFSSDGTNWYKV